MKGAGGKWKAVRVQSDKQFERLEQLEQLEQLERLEQLEQLERIRTDWNHLPQNTFWAIVSILVHSKSRSINA